MEIVSAHPGHAELTMLVRADMINGHGTCHGGLIFSLADSAFALACNSYNFKAVASGVRIDFLQPTVLGDRLNAVAEQISQGRRVGVYDVMVSDQKGSAIALFRGNSYRLDDE